MFHKITQSPTLVRVVPFALFLTFTFFQDRFGPDSRIHIPEARYWIYFAKSVFGAVLIFLTFRYIEELKWRFSWEAVLVGVGVFVMWVGLDRFILLLGFPQSYPKLSADAVPWNPHTVFGTGSAIATFFVVARIAGSSLVVPVFEEVFYRSFVYRYLASKDFLAVPLGKFIPMPFLVTSVVFGFTHNEWLAAILCGFAYQGLVIWKGRLGDAITAHAITNFLLGLWIVWRGEWHFW